MFLAKVALDIIAKHEKDNIGYLNQELFQEKIWNHKPITDIWGIGHGMAKRLYHMGIDTIGQIAKGKKERFIDLFGIMGEELYNHAHGIDNSSIQGIKDYDSYLTFKFGNYMELPPVEKRKVHPVSKLIV